MGQVIKEILTAIFSTDFSGPGGRVMGDRIIKSPGGRIINDFIDTGGPALIDPNPAGSHFSYDGAGRLTRAREVGRGHPPQGAGASPSSRLSDGCDERKAPA